MKPSLPPKPTPPKKRGEARESTAGMRPRAIRRRRTGRLLVARAAKLQRFEDLIEGTTLDPGDSLHLLSRGHFDTVTIPAWFARNHAPIERFTASSLTISRNSVLALESLDEDGLLGEARIAVQDLTMSRSEHRSHIEAIRAWMRDTRHTLRVAETHAKVFVLEFATTPPIVIESSANLSSNDNRLEQYAIHADASLAAFHLEWLDEIFAHTKAKLPRGWRPTPKTVSRP